MKLVIAQTRPNKDIKRDMKILTYFIKNKGKNISIIHISRNMSENLEKNFIFLSW